MLSYPRITLRDSKILAENLCPNSYKVFPARGENMSVLCNHKSLYIRWRRSLPSNWSVPPPDCLLVQKARSCRNTGFWLACGKSTVLNTLASGRLESHVLVCNAEKKQLLVILAKYRAKHHTKRLTNITKGMRIVFFVKRNRKHSWILYKLRPPTGILSTVLVSSAKKTPHCRANLVSCY